jgi:excisionase family DNA binding protein
MKPAWASRANHPPGAAPERGRLLRVPEVAARLGVHRNTVYNLIERGHLPAFQPGGRRHIIRIDEAEFERWFYGGGDAASRALHRTLRNLLRVERRAPGTKPGCERQAGRRTVKPVPAGRLCLRPPAQRTDLMLNAHRIAPCGQGLGTALGRPATKALHVGWNRRDAAMAGTDMSGVAHSGGSASAEPAR